jgi:hypothetical protein
MKYVENSENFILVFEKNLFLRKCYFLLNS